MSDSTVIRGCSGRADSPGIRRALLWAAAMALVLAWQVCDAGQDRSMADEAALQQEADYRVIAARCGTPGYEKQFYKQSKAAVAAGLIAGDKDLEKAEKSIEARRRNPLLVVATTADCGEKLVTLKALQKDRAGRLGHRRR
jgi:hypothetical protein